MLRKRLILLVGALMAAALLAGGSAGTATAASPTVVKRVPAKPWPGETTRLTGRVEPKGRPVVLQKAKDRRWANVKRARTQAAGTYVLAVRASNTRAKYRVVAPRAKVRGKAHKRVVSKPQVVLATRPRAALTFARTPVVKKNGRAYSAGRVKVTPANKNATVKVQRLTTGVWRTVRSGRLNNGTFKFSIQTGAHEYRAVVSARGTAASAVSARVKPGWRVSWRDEFTNEAQSRKTWEHRDLGSRHNRRICSTTGARQTTYPGGVMRLRLSKDSRPQQDPNGTKVKNWAKECPNGTYLNAMVGTDRTKTFKHGVFAARVKFQAPQGMHGAFWLQSNGTPEIDVAEYFGKGRADGGLASYLHSKPNAKGKMTSVGGVLKPADKIVNRGKGTAASRFHVYSVEWTKSGYVFRIDGKVTMRTKRLRSNDPHFIVLSLISSDWEMPLLKKSQLSKAYVDVDWVRVWQK